MKGKIISVWESPTNEGTVCYNVGMRVNQIPGSYTTERGDYEYEWTVGKISWLEAGWHGEGDPSRIDVYDTDNKLRASLPWAACGVTLEPEDA